MTDYKAMTDEKLIKSYRGGETRAIDELLERYKGSVRKKANVLFLIGADKDDLIQEGMIGLLKAVREFDESKNDSFVAFSSLCIQRQMYTAIEASNRLKNSPLNSYISLFGEEDDEEGRKLIESLEAIREDMPEAAYLDKEAAALLEEKIYKILSPLERKVLDFTLEGKSYVEIAEALNREPKSIDNALQRIKNKVEKLISK